MVLAAMLALWALPEDVMEQYLVLKKPMIQENGADVIVGRAVLPKILTQAEQNASKKVGSLNPYDVICYRFLTSMISFCQTP